VHNDSSPSQGGKARALCAPPILKRVDQHFGSGKPSCSPGHRESGDRKGRPYDIAPSRCSNPRATLQSHRRNTWKYSKVMKTSQQDNLKNGGRFKRRRRRRARVLFPNPSKNKKARIGNRAYNFQLQSAKRNTPKAYTATLQPNRTQL
jgi:hypothetical protein